jgi:hypothetical protein
VAPLLPQHKIGVAAPVVFNVVSFCFVSGKYEDTVFVLTEVSLLFVQQSAVNVHKYISVI